MNTEQAQLLQQIADAQAIGDLSTAQALAEQFRANLDPKMLEAWQAQDPEAGTYHVFPADDRGNI